MDSARFRYAVVFALGVSVVLLVWSGYSTLKVLTDERPTEGSAEVGFARDMSVHHAQAVLMSFIMLDRSDQEEIRTLAFDIINTQSTQRGMLMGWLDLWGHSLTTTKPPMAWMGHVTPVSHTLSADGSMPGMATAEDIEKLRILPKHEANMLYLELMIKHHVGGIEMAKGLTALGTQTTVVRLANTMVNGQLSEIDHMHELLKKL